MEGVSVPGSEWLGVVTSAVSLRCWGVGGLCPGGYEWELCGDVSPHASFVNSGHFGIVCLTCGVSGKPVGLLC